MELQFCQFYTKKVHQYILKAQRVTCNEIYWYEREQKMLAEAHMAPRPRVVKRRGLICLQYASLPLDAAKSPALGL